MSAKTWKVTAGVVGVMFLFGAISNGNKSNSNSTTVAESTQTVGSMEATKPAAPKQPEMSSGQRNALDAAKNYLESSGFSKAGLIDQLSSSAGDGYSRSDATFAVKRSGADWNAEAVEAAKNYLESSPMSKTALIEQLSSSAGDQFTEAQARYAANKVY